MNDPIYDPFPLILRSPSRRRNVPVLGEDEGYTPQPRPDDQRMLSVSPLWRPVSDAALFALFGGNVKSRP